MRRLTALLALNLFIQILYGGGQSEKIMGSYYLIDDFTDTASSMDRPWEGFTDQVMGGVSTMTVTRLELDGESFIRMAGRVSLENNGGFIQIRHKVASPLKPFDGSRFRGIRLKVRGSGKGYYIFLRTTSTVLPWKFYKSEITVGENWTTVDLPWESFSEGDYGRLGRFRADRLKSLALVAYGRDFQAFIDLGEIGFYK